MVAGWIGSVACGWVGLRRFGWWLVLVGVFGTGALALCFREWAYIELSQQIRISIIGTTTSIIAKTSLLNMESTQTPITTILPVLIPPNIIFLVPSMRTRTRTHTHTYIMILW